MVILNNTLLSVNLVAKNISTLIGIAAYIDPNTGGMLFQVLVVLFGVISGLLLFFSGRLKSVFYRIKRWMRRSSSVPSPETKQEESLQDKE